VSAVNAPIEIIVFLYVTAWSGVLIKRLIVTEKMKKFSALY
jgi:hypothetical protein